MKQKMFLTAATLVLLLSYSNPVRAGEITVNWRTMIDSTQINDLKFMPGQEQFIIGTGFEVQVRSCEDGSIITKYPFGAWRIEFTPDNNRLVSILPINGYKTLQLRNVNDMSLINEYALPEDEEGYGVSFLEMIVDPVRPLIYTIMQRGKYINGELVVYRKILIFDRESLNPVGELTTTEDEELLLVNMAVSKDGKYLAVMNEGISKLMVWSLDTRQKIVDKFIADQNSDKFSDPADVKFSELNTDKIYFTGAFYKGFGEENFGGLCIFSISENRIIDSTFVLGANKIGSSLFSIFENESKMIATTGVNLYILNLIENKIEYNKFNLGDEGIVANKTIYNENNRYFLGGGGIYLNKFIYQPNTGVPDINPKEIIYPNPTTGIVNIPINCVNTSKYEIFNSSGKLIKSSNLSGVSGNLLTIDFTQYLAGVYSVKVYCGKQISQYQIMKEG